MMDNNWLNTQSLDEPDLVSLSTGTVAPPAMVKDLLRAFEVGEQAYRTFKRTILDDSAIREILRQDDEAKTENVLNNQHKDIPNESKNSGSEGRPKPLEPDDPGC